MYLLYNIRIGMFLHYSTIQIEIVMFIFIICMFVCLLLFFCLLLFCFVFNYFYLLHI